MPSLKQLTCTIELGSSHTKVAEYGKDYGDGHVTSYIAVPSEEVNFSIHLTSQGYIAPGLAMFVYMDGQYQCNRNRRGLQVPSKGVRDEHVEVDLRVRQKESKQADGSFLGRDWTFAGLNLVSADKVEETDEVFLDNLGTIEVIVLRCKDAPLPPPSAPLERERSSRPTTKPASKHSEAQKEQKEPSKPSSSSHRRKEPSTKAKEPSKTPSKHASVKPAADKESSVGFMAGMFASQHDGASDEPDHSINPKPYWNDWNKRPSIPSSRPTRNLYIAPEEPMPLVPKQVARAKHVEHQVKTGKGAQYLHLCARPEYLDSMKQPYAVFTFKYRSKRSIEKKFKIEIKDEGKALKAKLADMSKDELAEELFRLRMAQESKEKAHSAAKAPHELHSNSKTPSVSKSKKEAATPAQDWSTPDNTGDWANPPTQDWNNPKDPKPASKAPSKAPSKTPSKVPSKTPSQKTKDAPGSYPDSASSHHTASEAAAAAAEALAAASAAAKSASKESASKKSKKEEPVVAEATAGAEQTWDQPQEDNAWDATPAAAGGWDTTPAAGNENVQWGLTRIIITIIGIAVAIAILVIAYYWIKSYLLKAIALLLLLKSWVVAPVTWAKKLWVGLTDLKWMLAPFAWVWTCVKKGLLWIWELGDKVKIGKPKFLEFEAWEMEWLSWPDWSLSVPEIVKDGFEVFVPEGVQAVEDVLEEL